MTTHQTKSVFGKPLRFQTRDHDRDDPLELTIEYGKGRGAVLVTRADAIILRDMLIEALGAPERPQEPATTKPGEPVYFEASNGYTIVDRSPYALTVRDAAGEAKYQVGKYTVAALREYFERPYVAPEPPAPTIREQVEALEPGTRFTVPDSGGATYTRLQGAHVVSEGGVRGAAALLNMDVHCHMWGQSTTTIEVV